METTKVISQHGKDSSNGFYFAKDSKGNVVKGTAKVVNKKWCQYVVITTLANGKKTSVTRHGLLPE